MWRGQINPAGEADYFSLGHLAAGQLVGVEVQREGNNGLYPLLLLANSSGQVVDWGEPFRSGALDGVAFFETIIPQADDYYAVVVGDATQAGGSTPCSGAYDLFYDNFGVTEDAYEPNNSKAQVDAATAGAANSPNLGVVGQVTTIANLAMMDDSEDWFRFQTTATGGRNDYVRIMFTNAQGNLNLDLLDSQGNLLRRSQALSDNELVSLEGSARRHVLRPHLGLQRRAQPALRSADPDRCAGLSPHVGPLHHRHAVHAAIPTGQHDRFGRRTVGDGRQRVDGLDSQQRQRSVPVDLRRHPRRLDGRSDQLPVRPAGPPFAADRCPGSATSSIEYDPLGRLTYVDGPDMGDASAFTYDADGNITQMADLTDGTTQYTYDDLNRLTQITMPNGEGTVGYTYDAAGRVASITYPGGSTVSYVYDAAGRMSTVTDGANVTTYTYNAAGQLATMTDPNGIVAAYGYDDYGRLTDLGYTKAGATVTAFHYTLDANGNRTQMVVTRPSGSATYGYAYDAQNRLVQATYPDGSVVTYTYDANGNRLSTSTDPDGGGPQPAVVENYHYGQDNRLESITGAGGTLVKQFYYDPSGNVVMMVTPTDTTRYKYDYRNLLTSVEDGTNRIEYVYDGRGDRVAQYVNGVRTNFRQRSEPRPTRKCWPSWIPPARNRHVIPTD